MTGEFVTVFNFECKDCGTRVGQLVHQLAEGEDKENFKCPNCGSSNCSYGTAL